MKKVISLVLCLAMVLTCLAGCGTGAADGAAAPAAASSEASSTDAGSTDAGSAEDLPFVELTWYCCGQPQEGYDAVFEKVNEYLKEKLNCSVKLISYDYGSYDEMLNIAAQAGDEFDLVFTCNWLFDIENAARKGYIIPLDDLIAKYGQGYLDSVPQKYRDGALIDGQTYGLINYQIMAKCTGLQIAKDWVDKYDFDVESVHSLADMEPLFEKVKAEDPSMYGYVPDPTSGSFMVSTKPGEREFEMVMDMGPAAIRFDDPSKIVNIFESEAYKQHAELMHSWYEKGYIRSDAISLTDLASEQATGKYVCWIGGNTYPGSDSVIAATVGYPIVNAQLAAPVAGRNMNLATLTGISSTSKNPERAMQLLNLIFTDEYLFNLICFGIEGETYEFNDDGTVSPIPAGGYNPGIDWAYGNQFNAFRREGQAEDVWDQIKAVNDSAAMSPIGTFSFNESNVKTEYAMVSAVVSEYDWGFETGTYDPAEKLPEFLQALDEAGWPVVQEEMQKQYDEYLAAQ